ncbi:MAG: tetratricopeptide repeat protein [Candidatus Acidiferrales bacterium]
MPETDAVASFKQGVQLLKGGYAQKAQVQLRRCVELDSANPYYLSFLGLAIARSEGRWAEATKLCETALQLKKKELQLHLNLAEVYMASGQRQNAILTLDQARQSFGPNARLLKARSRAEKRRAPILPFLDRNNPLNKSLGKLRHRAARQFATN